MKKLVLIVVVLFSAFAASSAQEIPSPRKDGISIGDTKISRDGNELIVDYAILLGDQVLSCKVNATLLVDGKPFKHTKEIKGDIGKIRQSGYKQIRYDIKGQQAALAGKDISFRLDVSGKDVLKTRYLIMATASPLAPRSYGLTLGAVRRYGGYVNFQSNFVFGKIAHTADRQGVYEDGDGIIWTSHNPAYYQSLKVTGGLLIRAHKAVYPYVGAGYGYHNYIIDDVYGDHIRIRDYSPSGAVVEAGIIFRAGPVAISAGAGTVMFKTVSLDVGLGVMF